MQNLAMLIAAQGEGEAGMMKLNPALMQDQRVLECFMAYMGLDMGNMGGPGGPSGPTQAEPFRPDEAEERRKKEEAAKKKKAEEEARIAKENEKSPEQKAADLLKDEGNAL